jgi:hypothetical protein
MHDHDGETDVMRLGGVGCLSTQPVLALVRAAALREVVARMVARQGRPLSCVPAVRPAEVRPECFLSWYA